MANPRCVRRLATQVAEVVVAVPWFVTAPVYRRWHLRWGATDDETTGPMPGDELVPMAHFTATRAITIDAPREQVWPWLVQTGFRRAGFYSYDLLDSLGAPSADEILAEFQHPAVGDLAAPMTSRPTPQTSFVVAVVERPEYLVWSKPDSSWSWRLTARAGDRTRLVTRLKQRYRMHPSSLVTVPLMEFGDFPMMRKMLRGIQIRAETTAIS